MKRFDFSLWLLIISSFVVPVSGQSKLEKDTVLHQLFEEITSYERLLNQSGGMYRGIHPERIGFHTSDDYDSQLDQYRIYMDRIMEAGKRSLNSEDRISLETMDLKLSGQIDQLEYKSYLIPFNAEGGFFNSLSSAMRRLPFETEADFLAYAKWLPTYAEYLNGHISLLRQGIAEGIIAPKVIVKNTIAQIEPWTFRNTTSHKLTAVLSDRPQSIDVSRWKELKAMIIDIMNQTIWPAYDSLYAFVKTEYLEAAYDRPGISNIPNGKEYYEKRVSYFTTLDVTPDEVYDIGLSEVMRIRSLMEDIVEELNFEGNFQDFLRFLRTDEQFYAKTPQELLSYAAWLSKKAEGKLPPLFSHLYELPFTVEPVPDDIAPTYTGGRYVQGNRKQDRPGIYWVNTYNLPARSLYNLPALTVHEAVPGHHLQIMLAAELTGLPSFRNRFYISAFGEGWGLYSEYLGEEMGMYETLYDQFGRYTYEMWRACRLVVDVGLHYKDWPRDQAVEFLSGNTALSLHEVNTEIDRYIGWPGQALSYKMGEITIKKLRRKAEKTLKDKFDIKEFHYRVLKNGSIPLPSLIREIETWIDNHSAHSSWD